MFSKFPRERLLPFDSHFISVGDQRMHYLDEGSGPAVLLLHGNPTWCFYYRNLIARLRGRYRVIAPDYIGCGLSARPKGVLYRASDRINHMAEFVDALGLKRFSLVMHDWGGPIGTGVAVRDPGRIERLVYLNTTLTETESLPYIIKLAASPWVGPLLTRDTRRFLKFTTELGVARRLPRDVKAGYFFPYRTAAQRAAIWGFVDDIPFDSSHPSYAAMLELAHQLDSLKDHPVQIIWGLKDPCFHREMLSKVARYFPQAEVIEIPTASHLVLEDAPELVGESIERFFSTDIASASKRDLRGQGGSNEANALVESLFEVKRESPQGEAVITPDFQGELVQYRHMTFQDLAGLVNKYHRGLRQLGVQSGDRVLILIEPGIEFLSLSYAVMACGATPVFLDPGMGREKIRRCIGDLEPQGFIGNPRAHLLRVLYPSLFRRVRVFISSGWVPFRKTVSLSFLRRFSSAPLQPVPVQAALIAFTSGATGTPKGVVFTNAMIRAQLRIFSDVFGLKRGDKDLPLLPIFSLFHLPLGVCSVVPPLDPARPLAFDASRMARLIKDLGIGTSFGSPTLWNKLAEYCIRSQTTLSELRGVFMAGAPVPVDTLERVQQVIGGRAYTPYGATEALPVTLVSAEALLEQEWEQSQSGEQGTLVGKPVSGVQLVIAEVVEGDFNELGPHEIGEVLVSGSNVSPLYLNRPDANKWSKIVKGGVLWHRMGDMGYRGSDGSLYFCGRERHMVRGADRTYYSVPVERIFNAHTKVRRSALVGVRGGTVPGVVIEPEPRDWPESEASRQQFISELSELAQSDNITREISEFFFHRSFPVDARHNAKIFRDQLSQWASQQGS